MWEWYEIFTWLGKNALWLLPLLGVVYYVGRHMGYNKGYEEGQQSVLSTYNKWTPEESVRREPV